MKKIFTSLLLAIILLLLPNCTFQEDLERLQNTLDSVQVYVSNPEFNTKISIVLVDASNGHLLSDKDIQIEISGKDADKILSSLGTNETSFQLTYGSLNLVVNPMKIDTTTLTTNPMELKFDVNVDGYLPYSQAHFLSSPSLNVMVIPLINKLSPPIYNSYSEKSHVGTIGSNGTSTTITTHNSVDGTQGITLSVGTQFVDAAGQAISGILKTEFITYSPSSYAAIRDFLSGKVFPISFNPISMFRFNMTANGKPISQTKNGAVTVDQELPADAVNPDTGESYKEGETVDVWIMNNETGKMEKVGTAVVTKDGDTFVLKITITANLPIPASIAIGNTGNTNEPAEGFEPEIDQTPEYSATVRVNGEFSQLYTSLTGYESAAYRSDQSGDIISGDYPFVVFRYKYKKDYQGAKSFQLSIEPLTIHPAIVHTFSPSVFNISDGDSPGDAQTFNTTVTETITEKQVEVQLSILLLPEGGGSTGVKPSIDLLWRMPEYPYYNRRVNLKHGQLKKKFFLDTDYHFISYVRSGFTILGSLHIDDLGDSYKVTASIKTENVDSKEKSMTFEKIAGEELLKFKLEAELPDNIMNLFK